MVRCKVSWTGWHIGGGSAQRDHLWELELLLSPGHNLRLHLLGPEDGLLQPLLQPVVRLLLDQSQWGTDQPYTVEDKVCAYLVLYILCNKIIFSQLLSYVWILSELGIISLLSHILRFIYSTNTYTYTYVYTYVMRILYTWTCIYTNMSLRKSFR